MGPFRSKTPNHVLPSQHLWIDNEVTRSLTSLHECFLIHLNRVLAEVELLVNHIVNESIEFFVFIQEVRDILFVIFRVELQIQHFDLMTDTW